MVPKYLDEKRDFVVACLRTCEGNLIIIMNNNNLFI